MTAPEKTRPSRWTAEQAALLERTPETTVPVVGPPEPDPMPHLHIWDSWLLRDRHGQVATVDGWRVQFSLTSPSELLPGKRHDVAQIRAFYSRDGVDWHDAGPVFTDALGQREWAGSALYDDGDVYLYYTAAGEDDDEAELSYTQRIAVAHGGSIQTTDDGVTVEGPWTHEVLLEPDGKWYETEAQSEGMIYTFRDPWFYEDPATGETYLLFESNAPVGPDDDRGDAESRMFNGCIGVAVSESGDPLDWELRPPLLDSIAVNQELERPHVLRHDGRYYLFISSHMHTFAPGLAGYDALYGFVAESFTGPYRPLNESGLVVTNPPEAPFQSYSWMVVPHSEDVLVGSFVNYHDFAGASLDELSEFSPEEQQRRFGGSMGPVVRLAVDGDQTRIRGLLDHWRLLTPDQPIESVGYRSLSEARASDALPLDGTGDSAEAHDSAYR